MLKSIRFVTKAEEKTAFERAAELRGMSLSAWIRLHLRKASSDALKEAGERAHFLPRLATETAPAKEA
jgi:hypothetical protein